MEYKYERFLKEALIKELRIRVEGRLRDELLNMAEKIIAEELAKTHFEFAEYVKAEDLGTHLSINVGLK